VKVDRLVDHPLVVIDRPLAVLARDRRLRESGDRRDQPPADEAADREAWSSRRFDILAALTSIPRMFGQAIVPSFGAPRHEPR